MQHLTRGIAVIAALCAGPVAAHEFWIEPIVPLVAEDAPLQADIRVGEKLNGGRYAYLPRDFTRFDLVQGDSVVAVDGRAGDRPALNMVAAEPGLTTVVHVTRDYSLTYTDWQKFLNFAKHKDFPDLIERHKSRGLPETKFKETYSRHAKSLMAVGTGAGQDRAMGLEVEIVAQTNPFTDDLTAGFDVLVLYQGAPVADGQVEVFTRLPEQETEVALYRTDAEGRARIAVTPGALHLVDHVVMRALEPAAPTDAVWESLWASLTFVAPK